MNEENEMDKPHRAAAAHQELVQHEVPEILQWLRAYGIQSAVALVLALIAVTGWITWRNHRHSQAAAAAELFAVAQEPGQFEDIVQRYGRTPTGPMALLALAAAEYRSGDWNEARAAYNRFERDYPGHTLSPIAALGQAYCLEAAASWDEAGQAYRAFQASHPSHYLTPLARFGEARIFEMRGDPAAARMLYEDFIVAEPDSSWTASARTALATLNRLERATRPPLAAPTAANEEE